MTAAWTRRGGLLVAILALLFAVSYTGGTTGLFSNSERRIDRELHNPATRLTTAADLADRFAKHFAGDRPTVPGARSEHDCPAPAAATATSIIGAVDPSEIAVILRAATADLTHTGWTVGTRSVDASTTSVKATNRRSVSVEIAAHAGDQLASIDVTISVPCQTHGGTAVASSKIQVVAT